MTCWGLSGFLTSARVVFPPWPWETALPCLPVGEDSLEALRDCGPLAFGCDAGWLQTALLNIHLFLSLSRVTETLLGAEVLQQSNLMLVVTEEVEFRLGGSCAWWQRRSLRSQRKVNSGTKWKSYVVQVNIQVPAPELQSDIITITGLAANMDRAKAGLLERVKELQAEQEDRVRPVPVLPSSWNLQLEPPAEHQPVPSFHPASGCFLQKLYNLLEPLPI